jgi:cardiolipin synthase
VLVTADGVDGPDGVDGSLDRILTVPNVITTGRLLFLPLYLWLLLGQQNRLAAAALLAAMGATDWCDGYVARRTGQVSNLGKVLDPTADRILFFVGIGGIMIDGSVPLWFCGVVLGREVVVAAITVVITALGAKPVDVTWFGKAGTFGLMFAFPLLLAGAAEGPLGPVLTALGWVAGLPGLVLSYYAAVLYVPKWRVNLREGRAARRAASTGA